MIKTEVGIAWKLDHCMFQNNKAAENKADIIYSGFKWFYGDRVNRLWTTYKFHKFVVYRLMAKAGVLEWFAKFKKMIANRAE